MVSVFRHSYPGQSIPVHIKISEKYGRFSKDKDISLNFNQAMAMNKIVVEADKTQQQIPQIIIGSLSSDVDKSIPRGTAAHNERYALVIGNEDYSSYQTGLSIESNVEFAINDARVFSNYIEQTLGVPVTQVKASNQCHFRTDQPGTGLDRANGQSGKWKRRIAFLLFRPWFA